MKRLFYVLPLLFLCGASLLFSEESLSPLPFTRISTVPPGIPNSIAVPLAGGPLRILFFGQRELVGFSWSEIAARLECVSESVLTESREELSPARAPASPDSVLLLPGNITGRASELLGNVWDVIWLDYNFKALPEPLRIKLLERIEQGSGLVYVGNPADFAGIARSGKFDRMRLRAVSFPRGALEFVGERGKGIILAMNEFDRRSGSYETGDYFTGAVGALMLASGRFRGFWVTGVQDAGKPIEHESMSIMNFRVEFHNEGPRASRTVHVRYRNGSGQVVHETEDSYDMSHGRGFFRVTYPMLSLGVYSADISIMDGGKVIALAGKTFMVRSEDMLEGIVMRDPTVTSGEYMMGRVRLSQEMEEGMVLVVELFDHLGRQIDRNELVQDTKRKWEDFAFKATDEMGGVVTVRASLYKNNVLIHAISASQFIRKKGPDRRFSLIVSDKAADEPWLIPGYTQLTGTGVSAFALDMQEQTPSEAFRAVREVLQAGGIPIPVIPLGTGGGNDGAGIHALVDTLLQMPISECWIKDIAEGGTSGNESGRFRSVALSGFFKAGENGGKDGTMPPELFFDRGREFDRSELRIAPWRNMFRGIGAVCWEGVSGKAGDALVPGGGLNPSFSLLAGECRQIMDGIDLLLSGAKRDDHAAVSIKPDRPGAKTVLFRDGGVQYIGILPDPMLDTDSTGSPMTVSVADIAVPMHLYDIREGVYKGKTAEISFSMKRDEAELLALLPYRVKDIDIQFASGIIHTGEELSFEANIVPQEAGTTPGRHVLSVRFYSPDGSERSWLRSEQEAPEGKVKASFLLPPGEPQGKWILQVRDVVSGKKMERPFIIMPSGETTGK